jgi:hypothetical protein
MTFIAQRFPEPLAKEITALVDRHKNLQDEPLLLAICYDPGRDPGDVFIFEVIDHFGGNMVDPERDLFEVAFGASTSVDMKLPPECKIHLVLTNPNELSAAVREDWSRAQEITKAISRGDFEILFEDGPRGKTLLQQLLPPEAAE